MALKLFALNESRDLGAPVAAALSLPLAAHEERAFEDGEHKARPLENVRGADVYVLQSLYEDEAHSVNDKLVRLLFFLGALRDASATRVTAVMPYLCYSRKDRRSKPRDPLSTRYVASLLEAVGVDCVVTLDVHNLAAYQNAFRIEAVHLEAKKLFVDHFARCAGDAAIAVVSPDIGGVKRADAFADSLSHRLARPVERAFMEKRRSEGVVSGDKLVGEVKDRSVIVIDDLIASGGTIARAVNACAAHGAHSVYAAATHGLFTGNAGTLLANPALRELVVTDSVPAFRLGAADARSKLSVVSCVPLLAQAIRRLHEGGSVVELLQD